MNAYSFTILQAHHSTELHVIAIINKVISFHSNRESGESVEGWCLGLPTVLLEEGYTLAIKIAGDNLPAKRGSVEKQWSEESKNRNVVVSKSQSFGREPPKSEKNLLNMTLYAGICILIYQGEHYLQLVSVDFCMMQAIYSDVTSQARITNSNHVDDTG